MNTMEALERNARGLSLLVKLNWDRFFFSGAIVAALGTSAYLATLAQ